VLREEKGYTYGVRAFAQPLRSNAGGTGQAMLAISGSVDTASTAPALADTWTILRTLAAEGLTDAERDEAVQFLVGIGPLKYETAGSVAATLADQVEQHLPDDFQAEVYRQLAGLDTGAATAAVVAAFPPDRLVTVLVGDASVIAEDVKALGIGEVTVIS
jgi:predicted Zn-dependent peptidase